MTTTPATILKTRTGEARTVSYGHPLWSVLDNRRVRFCRQVDSRAIEVMDDNGKPLPHWCHPTQLFAY